MMIALEIENVSSELDYFGVSLPAKDRKFQVVDKEDGKVCLAIQVEISPAKLNKEDQSIKICIFKNFFYWCLCLS
jgi:hypothetical protein